VSDQIDIEKWARDMGAFANAVAEVLRYEGETLHEAATRGIDNASETLSAAFRTVRGQSDEG